MECGHVIKFLPLGHEWKWVLLRLGSVLTEWVVFLPLFHPVLQVEPRPGAREPPGPCRPGQGPGRGSESGVPGPVTSASPGIL